MGIAGLIDDRHAAFAQFPEDLEVRQTPATHGRPRVRISEDSAWHYTPPALSGQSPGPLVTHLAQSSHRRAPRATAEVGLPQPPIYEEAPSLRGLGDWCGREDSNLHDLAAASS